ncbi:NADPH2:quinone reductase [Pseudomonas citronellolis]|uniref:quinone oxidoreductase family protein n=1 Tax=Pseudomonas citronellolis TaxID=53408 RepID=UPI0020A08A86|nr:quinone oxidoreductase [Pseudomonas citronellolis]MCP1645221.1 NADPH2:quinone reductase [Pseudomonas citronellolis]MCP1668140.1 NADPH2:quinone reductase [Pseudomonas citronellolis]MCP1699386.1 NADPH2:quinone reductase [Pseudomonas citronellolis]MCP1705917.1 NADPH2:quinone reductase [Pseudomonas citronellolis]MCP1800030.1 NADPH2:quinone reductase [Pseudomonas citronellolis]
MSQHTGRVIRIDQPGGPEALRVVEVAVGKPGPGEVRIRHHAVGVNFLDIYQRKGLYGLPFPLQLGMEGAGVVEAVGAGVEHLREGDRVAYAGFPPGAYCDVRLMPAMTVCRLPDAIDFETGAAMMLKGWTACYLLTRCPPVEGLHPGDSVLFHAAAGGVGLIACQWARALGLQLIATAGSDEKCRLALEHGAAHAINYRREDFVERVREITGGRGVKVVYDSVGRDTFEKSLDCLAPFGLLVAYGDASGPAPAIAPLQLVSKGSLYLTYQGLWHHVSSRERAQALSDELFARVARGDVRIPLMQRYPLEQAAAAHRDLEARRTSGCIVLLPAGA